jgi:hypothetical protein
MNTVELHTAPRVLMAGPISTECAAQKVVPPVGIEPTTPGLGNLMI